MARTSFPARSTEATSSPVPNLISVERASLALGTTQVLDAVSLGLGGGDRIGIVGRNGGGKTTLLRVLSGTRTVDSGRVARVGGLTVGTLSQDDTLDPTRTVHEVVLRDLPEHEWAADPRIRDILEGLLGGTDGAGVGGLDATIAPLSGGERRRIALAALLVQRPDVLLLDEPTNHLDVEGVAWLADHLVRRHSSPTNAILAITHDRWFLDAVAGQTWEVENGAVHAYEGGYAAFVLAKAERSRIAAVTADRRDNLLRKELAWLRRGAPARTSKPKFRIEAANALIAAEPPPRDDVELVGFATSRLGKDVIDLQDASVEVAGRALLGALAHLGMAHVPAPPRFTGPAARLTGVVLRASPGDRLARDWHSFDTVQAGDVIAWRADGQPLRVAEDGCVLFPYPQAEVGQEWFYVAVPDSA